MQEITFEEFVIRMDREEAIFRARGIFIKSGITDNITVAFELYQGIFAEREREIFLSATGFNNHVPSVMDRHKRPPCLDCGSPMLIRALNENQEGWKTQWVCSHPECNLVLTFKEPIDYWMDTMKRGVALNISEGRRGTNKDPIPGRKYRAIKDPCPECDGILYEYDVCCGAPEGLIECGSCDFSEKPSIFYAKEKSNGK